MRPRSPLELTHHHPGRLRVRSDALCRGDRDPDARERFEKIRRALHPTSGVRAIRLGAHAGSVLVEYEPGTIDPNALIDAIARAADLDPPLAEEERRPRRVEPGSIVDAARKLNTLTHELSGGRADLRSLVPLAMSGFAAFSFVTKKDRLPRWDNLAYWAFSIFLALHADEIDKTTDRVP